MSDFQAITNENNESEDETEGADEVSDFEEDHEASTIQADIGEDDSEALDPRIQVRFFNVFKT